MNNESDTDILVLGFTSWLGDFVFLFVSQSDFRLTLASWLFRMSLPDSPEVSPISVQQFGLIDEVFLSMRSLCLLAPLWLGLLHIETFVSMTSLHLLVLFLIGLRHFETFVSFKRTSRETPHILQRQVKYISR